MNSSKGFLLIETAAMILLVSIVLLAGLKMYGTCILWMQKNNELQQINCYLLQYRYHAKPEISLPGGLQTEENKTEAGKMVIKEVQVKDGEKIICNMVWAE